MKGEAVEGLVPRDIIMCFHCSSLTTAATYPTLQSWFPPPFIHAVSVLLLKGERGLHKSHLTLVQSRKTSLLLVHATPTSICSTSYKIHLNNKCIVIRIDQLDYCFSIFASKYILDIKLATQQIYLFVYLFTTIIITMFGLFLAIALLLTVTVWLFYYDPSEGCMSLDSNLGTNCIGQRIRLSINVVSVRWIEKLTSLFVVF